MSLTIAQIAEAFSRHSFEKTYPYLLDTIQWNLENKTTIASCDIYEFIGGSLAEITSYSIEVS